MTEHKTHRVRRGKLVEIPEQWRGVVPSNQTMLQRKSGRIQARAMKKSSLRKLAKQHWNDQVEEHGDV